jgi:hypothetical protein
MNLETYDLLPAPSGFIVEFISVGPKGRIKKIVSYTELATPGFYNLSFGDVDPLTGAMNDRFRSGNGDAEKVLATIVQTIMSFTKTNPRAIIQAKGSTEARTRLYQMGISRYLDHVHDQFKIYGYSNGGWELFAKGTTYEAFLAHRINIRDL